MIYSMTGFAVLNREVRGGNLHIELRSVNSRYLDLSFRIGEELRIAEPQLRELFNARLRRGKVECRASFQPPTATLGSGALNADLVARLARLQEAVRAAMPEAAVLSTADVLRWPGVLADDAVSPDELAAALVEMAGAAMEDLLASRRREGEKLAATIRERIERVGELARQVEPMIEPLLEAQRDKLTARLVEALGGADQERVRQEVALFATRIDVAEELARLQAHVQEVVRVLKAGGAAGKRLDFLMQELNREANTLASKSASAEVTGVALELKLLIEQMREQVQNIE